MTLPRRARRIVVDGEPYRWLVSGRELPRQIRLLVQHDGGRGSKLCVRFAYVRIERPTPGGGRVDRQQTVVSPAFVREAIRHGLKVGWCPTGAHPDVVVIYDDGFRNPGWKAPDGSQRVTWDPLVEMVVGGAPGSTRPPAEWILHWSEGGRDPLAAAWEASRDPGVMLDVLEAARPERCRAIEQAFAARSGPVAQLFERHPPDTPGSIRDDLSALADAARRSVTGEYAGAFHHEVIWLTDVGSAGDPRRFCAAISDLIRMFVPEPPTMADYRPELVAWVQGVLQGSARRAPD